MSSDQILQVSDVNKVFIDDDREVFALKEINLDATAGEFICILGPSGCGKSTLLNAIAGFTKPTSGTIFANHHEVIKPGPDRAMVFQEYALFPWMTVRQNVNFALTNKKMTQSEKIEKVDHLLEQLHLIEFHDRFPKDLSGGMRQRVAIARALAMDSPMMLMDEPFGALDALTRHTLQVELLRIWQEFKKTIIFVTHSIQESIYLATRIVVMTYRPGTIKKIVEVSLPYPRDINSLEFIALQSELTEMVMEEQKRSQAANKNQS